MLVNRREYATGLGDLASTLKARSAAHKPTTAPGLVSTYGTNLSQKVATSTAQNKVLSLIGQQTALANYNRDVAAGNINPAFNPPPTAPSDATLAAAKKAYANQVMKTGTVDQKAAPSLVSLFRSLAPSAAAPTSTGLLNMSKPAGGIPMLTPAGTPAPAPVAVSPALQAVAQQVAQQQSAIDTSGGGGGGGGGGDDSTAPMDTTDATLPEPTGWAAMSTGTKVAIVGGGLVVVGGIYYLIKHRR